QSLHLELNKRFLLHVKASYFNNLTARLHSIDFTKSIALVFGNEHSGVSDEIRALADGNFIIPQVGIIQSLNISVACAVTLYEAFRQKSNAGQYNQPGLDAVRYNELFKEWEDNSR
ncbi:MAG: TrmH family RNA methyltransferase, partial [Chitinophagaceae bacterium]